MAKRYFINQDYSPLIQSTHLIPQLCQNDPNILYKAENYAMEEIKAYTQQRYDMDAEFSDSPVWSPIKEYAPGDRFYIDYATYSTGVTYSHNDCVIYNNQGFVNSGATVSGAFDPNYWTFIGNRYQIYHALYPNPLFDLNGDYNKSDLVYYKNHNWRCEFGTYDYTFQDREQFLTLSNVPQKNVAPDSPFNNDYKFWSDLGTYSIPAGTKPTISTYFNDWDNRSQVTLINACQIVLYTINKSISPMNIVEHRAKGYKEAIKYFQDIGLGKLNSPVLKEQPTQGMSIRYGADPRKLWSW